MTDSYANPFPSSRTRLTSVPGKDKGQESAASLQPMSGILRPAPAVPSPRQSDVLVSDRALRINVTSESFKLTKELTRRAAHNRISCESLTGDGLMLNYEQRELGRRPLGPRKDRPGVCLPLKRNFTASGSGTFPAGAI